MSDDRIPIGGAILPILILSGDEKDLMRIYRPKLDSESSNLIAAMISDIFNLQSVLKHSVINLSPYPVSQLLDSPEDLRRIIIGSTITAYIVLLARKGYRDDEIQEILKSRRRFDKALSDTPFVAIGYDHEVLRRNIKALPKELWFPPPEPRITNLMDRLSIKAKDILSSIDVKYVDLAVMIMGGVIIPDNIDSWIRDIKDRQVEIKKKTYILDEVIEQSYGLLDSVVIASFLAIIQSYNDEKEVKKFLEDIVEKNIEAIENSI